jgi:CcmD family protein
LALKSYAFLFWAYNVIWLLLAGYLLFVVERLGRVGRRLDAVERALDEAEKTGDHESSGS